MRKFNLQWRFQRGDRLTEGLVDIHLRFHDWYSITRRSSLFTTSNAMMLCAMLSRSVQFSSFAQSCPTPWDPMDCSSPGFSAHGDSPDKNTGVGSMPSSRGSSQPRDWIQLFHIADKFFTIWATRGAQWWGVCILLIRKLRSRKFVTFPRQKAKIYKAM